MIELLFVVCLSSTPEACEERSLLYVDITPMTCMMGAQPALAQWANTHPGYVVESWRCQMVKVGQHDA